ncbi:hypothetical protein MHYP_G00352280 [Metynnis hypsauchen]
MERQRRQLCTEGVTVELVLEGVLEPIPAVTGRKDTPWTGRQSVSEQTDQHTHSLTDSHQGAI